MTRDPGAGVVVALHRYPVKSVLGEGVDLVEVDARGVRGDRTWAFRTDDGGIGSGKNSRRFRRIDGLLQLRSTLPEVDGDAPLLHLPDGRVLPVDDPGAGEVLTGLLGRPVELRPETTEPYHDDSPLHLVTTTSLRTLTAELGYPVEVARFRPNVVVDTLTAGVEEGYPDDAWIGREIALGEEVVLRVDGGMPRCVMVTAEQGDLPRAPGVLHTLGRVHDVEFGVQASVVRTGVVRRGDVARLLA